MEGYMGNTAHSSFKSMFMMKWVQRGDTNVVDPTRGECALRRSKRSSLIGKQSLPTFVKVAIIMRVPKSPKRHRRALPTLLTSQISDETRCNSTASMSWIIRLLGKSRAEVSEDNDTSRRLRCGYLPDLLVQPEEIGLVSFIVTGDIPISDMMKVTHSVKHRICFLG